MHTNTPSQPSSVPSVQHPPKWYHREPKYDEITENNVPDNDDEEEHVNYCDQNHRHVSFPPPPPPSHSSTSPTQRTSRFVSHYCYHSITGYIKRHSSFISSILCGQCVAMIVTSMNTSSYLLITQQHVNTNFFQLFFVYILIALLNQNYHRVVENPPDGTSSAHSTTTSRTNLNNTHDDHESIGHNNSIDDDDVDGRNATTDHDDDDDKEGAKQSQDHDLSIHDADMEKDTDDSLVPWNQRRTSHLNHYTTVATTAVLHDTTTTPSSSMPRQAPSFRWFHHHHRSNTTPTAEATTAAVPTPVFVSYTYSIPFWNIWNGSWTSCTVFQLHIPIYYYLLISMMDIVPNILSIYSFHFSTLTSTTLLGSLSIPSTMFFARLILRKLFTPIQYIGIVLCIIGGCYTIYIDSVTNSDDPTASISDLHANITSNATTLASENTDSDHPQTQPGQQQYIGDLMAITAALLYGLGDCVAEYFVKYINRKEYLYMIGIFGMMFTMIIVPIFEYNAVKDIFTNTITSTTTDDYNNVNDNSSSASILDPVATIGLFIWFVASVTLFYMIEALFLIYYDATLLNLSMQSVNLWAYMIMYIINPDGVPSSNFFIALLFVVAGVGLYEMGAMTDHQHYEVHTSNDAVIGDSGQANNRFISHGCIQDFSKKPRRDSEVEIVHGANEQALVNYQSLQLVQK